MNQKNRQRAGVVIATVVAGLVLSGGNLLAKTSKTTNAEVKCVGVNSCKGKGACSSADNTCKGHNTCKGKGWMSMKSEKACTAKGGTVVKDQQKS